MTMRSGAKWWLAAGLFVLACTPEAGRTTGGGDRLLAGGPAEPKVVVVIIDGPRYSETFGDSLHQHVSRIWSQLRPLGTICSNFRDTGQTLTIPGHATVLTGTWQVLSNDGLQRPPVPTLFEYFRKATGAPLNGAILVTGKSKLAACAYSEHPDYGAPFAGDADVGHATDVVTCTRLLERLDADHPRLALASFSDVDLKAHAGLWDEYLRQIEVVDSLLVVTWNHLQANPFYAGQTYLFVTADHGRHDDAHGGFQNHGDACDGCQHLIFLALGPDIRAGYEVKTLYTQRDVCATVGHVLGIGTPLSTGYRINELFEPVPTGIRD